MSEWQPIETAPKDGSRLLAFARGPSRSPLDVFYGVAAWVVADPDLNPGIPIDQLSLWDWPYAIRPTHWMPLPDAPLPAIGDRARDARVETEASGLARCAHIK